MFKLFKDKVNTDRGVEYKVARHFISKLQSPYVYRYCGNVRLKLDSKPVITEEKVALFEEKMVSIIKERIEFNGYTSIGDEIVSDVLELSGISYPIDRRTGEVVYIEESNVYSYVPGMNGAKKI